MTNEKQMEWAARLVKIANSMTDAMSQGGTGKIFCDPEDRDDILAAGAYIAALAKRTLPNGDENHG